MELHTNLLHSNDALRNAELHTESSSEDKKNSHDEQQAEGVKN